MRVPVEPDPNQTTLDELLGRPIAPVVGPAPESIQGRFEAFHEANPHVYEALARLAREWRGAGHDRCGVGMLFEVLRFRRGLRTQGDDFKLNNSYRSRYARLLEEREPDLAGLFEKRELQTR
jgi:hypothetical protein